MKQSIAVLFILMTLSCGAEDSNSDTKGGDKTIVSYWRHHSGPDNAALAELIQRFEAQNPEIHIDLKTFPYGVYTTKVVAAVTTGQGPAIVNIHGSWAYGYIGSRLIVPVPDDLISNEEFEAEFFPLAKSFALHGAYYAIPIGGANLGLYYNKRMFREAGIENAPKNWSELEETARKLTQRDENGRLTRAGASIGNMRGSGSQQLWNYFVDGVLPQAGLQGLSDDNRSVQWDTPEGAAALKWFTDFSHGDDAPNSILFPGAYDAFRLELSAMHIDGNWAVSRLNSIAPNLEYATAPLPSSDEGGRATYGTLWGNAVTRRSSSKVQAAAWKFLGFLAEYENMVFWSNATGEIPMRTEVLRDAAFMQDTGPLQPFLEQMRFARMSLKKDEGLYKSAIIDAADEVLLRDTDPAEAMHEAAERINAMLEER